MQPVDTLWVLLASTLVFFMQAGFACLEAGLTRAKNSINVAVKNLADFLVSCLFFWAIGYGLMFGTSAWGVVGTDQFFSSSEDGTAVVFIFQMVFCSTATTIVSGAVAERIKFTTYLAATVAVSVVIYPLMGHSIWNPAGFLSELGFVDFAGSTVVHAVGGSVALAGIIVLGPRIGRFRADGTPIEMTPSSFPLAVMGAMILVFGWIGFNGGSTLALDDRVPRIVMNTLIAGAAGGIAAATLGWKLRGVPAADPMINGTLAGLVGITAGCHAVSSASALVIGAVAGALVLGTEKLLLKLRLDDAVGAIPVHFAGGLWGTVAVGIFADLAVLDKGLGRWEQIGVQTAGTFGVALVAGVAGYAFFRVAKHIWGIRVSPDDELRGLNMAEHGAGTEVFELLQVMEQLEQPGGVTVRADGR